MTQHKSIDHRTGITYVYEVEKVIDKETGLETKKRHMIGRLDENGNVVPTSGRRGRLPKKENESLKDAQLTALKNEVSELKEKNRLLESQIAHLNKEKEALILGMQKLISQVTGL